MRGWLCQVLRFLRNEDGPTAVEYAVMLAFIIVVCFASVALLGSSTKNSFSNSSLTTAVGGS
jgi:pilus assembly protein Flp/PilA